MFIGDKKESFDAQFIKKFCPREFDKWEFLLSVGVSGGLLVAWKTRLFTGNLIFNNEFAISVEFTSLHNSKNWILTNVYGPCSTEGKTIFTNWLKSIEMPNETDWIVLGDFNLLRSPKNRNRPRGDLNEMFMFNAAISSFGLNEIPLQGRKFTWSNMQQPPLLEKLDWVFTLNS